MHFPSETCLESHSIWDARNRRKYYFDHSLKDPRTWRIWASDEQMKRRKDCRTYFLNWKGLGLLEAPSKHHHHLSSLHVHLCISLKIGHRPSIMHETPLPLGNMHHHPPFSVQDNTDDSSQAMGFRCSFRGTATEIGKSRKRDMDHDLLSIVTFAKETTCKFL